MVMKATESEFDIGARLKSARKSSRLSQRQLALRSGVTNGLISQIENNASSPSVSSLKRILDAIPMTLAEFFNEDDGEPKIFYRSSELLELNPRQMFPQSSAGDFSMSLRQVGNSSQHTLQMLHERYEPGADTGDELYNHQGEEAGIIIEGQIELTVGDETRTLQTGDAYIFDSTLPHRFRNLGDVDCVIVSACTPPSF